MANFESGYRSILGAKLAPADSTMVVATAPTVTSGRLYLNNGAQEERIKFTGVSGTTLTGLVRGLSKTADPATAGTGLTWVAGQPVLLVDMHDQLWDQSKPETITGNKTFSGDIVSSGSITVSGSGIFTKIFKEPVFADATARDAAIPSPSNGLRVYNTALGLFQKYQAGAWIDDTSGGSTANASETVAGKVQLNKAAAGNDIGSSGAALVPLMSDLKNLIDDTYPLGEAVTAGQFLFVENGIATASATTKQNICDSAVNTRVSMPIVGTGVTGTTFKMNLCKTASPAADLNFRIETDNAGSPSGTPVTNGTAATTAASLTTNLADTTVTLAGNVTLTLGTKYHIVMFQGTYGSETISGTNYYNVGYSTNDTTVRLLRNRNGSIWKAKLAGADVTDVGDTLTTLIPGVTTRIGYKVTAQKNVYIKSVTKVASATPTTCYIVSLVGNTVLSTATFSGNVATFSSPYYLDSGVAIRIECNSGASAYNIYYDSDGVHTGTNIAFTSGSTGGSDDIGNGFNIASITSNEVVTSFPYASSTLFQDKLLSLTDSDFSYKLPTDIIRASTEAKAIGTYPRCTFYGINSNQSTLTGTAAAPVTYYLNATPGSIGTSAGTNSYVVGKSLSATQIFIRDIIS